ncbi:CoA pyrophosphatase [Vibrio maerlii]|uniref:CoA pyrophosphatase n=1 Tax=Vibrio maerlii TaxID=2231648 RepID=UPI000E3E9744|nr:CoA pyrophosphatase [Vibrio maerlii]
MNKQQFLHRFNLSLPHAYHQESLNRLKKTPTDAMRQAAVLIALVERPNGLQVIFTKRASHLRHHPGQISFPGGKFEQTDGSLAYTAIREAEEEVGIPSSMIEVVGQLPTLPTISQFLVTPIIAFVNPDYQPVIDANEVELLFEAPAEFVFNKQNLFSQQFEINEHIHRIFAIPYQEHFIWGVTGQIIEAFQKQLTPVHCPLSD